MMMGKYTKKDLPGLSNALIEAFQFDGTLLCWKEIISVFNDIKPGGISYNEAKNEVYVLNISNTEGNHAVSIGDYILRNENGEYQVCKPDIFNRSFETVRETETNSRTGYLNLLSFSL
jgi:hypothetical protein